MYIYTYMYIHIHAYAYIQINLDRRSNGHPAILCCMNTFLHTYVDTRTYVYIIIKYACVYICDDILHCCFFDGPQFLDF